MLRSMSSMSTSRPATSISPSIFETRATAIHPTHSRLGCKFLSEVSINGQIPAYVGSSMRTRTGSFGSFGSMISFDLGSLQAAGAFLERLRLCSLGESLGGVETLISHPATMTHASIPEEERNRRYWEMMNSEDPRIWWPLG